MQHFHQDRRRRHALTIALKHLKHAVRDNGNPVKIAPMRLVISSLREL
jgi:hypothetical protein